MIVGATGDLAKRKLLPALYNLYTNNLIPEICEIIGFARSEIDSNEFRQLARKSIEERMMAKFDDVLHQYSREVGRIKAIFERHRDHPPCSKNQPPVGELGVGRRET